jgi:TRAP-type mannitol/chloroaromatic compound transport system permease large subunit
MMSLVTLWFFLCRAWGLLVSLARVHGEKTLVEVNRHTIRISAMVFGIVIGAQLFSLVFLDYGGDEINHEILSDLPSGTIGAGAVVMFILGFFLDFIEITFVVVPIVAPILLMMDVNPVWLGIMIASICRRRA